MNPSYLFQSSNFVPPELDTYLGELLKVLARIKAVPEDFIVEEVDYTGLQTTVSTESDLDESISYNMPTGPYVSVTLVERQLTTVDGIIRVAELLGVPREDVTYAGQKDRWSESSQRVNIKNVSFEHVLRNCCPEKLTGPGIFIKDPLPADELLHRGKLRGNRFRLRVLVPNMTKEQIEQYLAGPLAMLAKHNHHFPNFYGRQRLGQRQNLVKIGHAFITQGPEAAIKLFLTETSPNENSATTQVRQELLADWKSAEEKAAETGTSVAEQWPYWHGMLLTLNRARGLNLAVEHAIVEKTLQMCDPAQRPQGVGVFEAVIPIIDRELKSGPSLWIGAYQSFWFNQALAKHMRGEINIRGNAIPLYMRDPVVEEWYRRHGMPEAVPQSVDPFVAKMFLTPRPAQRPRNNQFRGKGRYGRGNQQPFFSGPRRKAFIPLQNMAHSVEDGVWNVTFTLRSGGYATTFLGMLFDLDRDDRVLADERLNY